MLFCNLLQNVGDVVIIGAGMAGLSAAQHLYKQGVKVLFMVELEYDVEHVEYLFKNNSFQLLYSYNHK